jgi:ribonuclease P protein component
MREGRRIRTRYLEIRALASPLGYSRVGIVVPRHRRSAVERNLLKRRIRELVRTTVLPQLPPVDVVFRASRNSYAASFESLATDVAKAGDLLSPPRVE